MHIFIQTIVCEDRFPSNCPELGDLCSGYASLCENDLNQVFLGCTSCTTGTSFSDYCGSIAGKLKDYCKMTCQNCYGKW